MCMGPEIAAIAALAAGTAGSYGANRQNRAQVEEMNRRKQAEDERQRTYRAESDARLKDVVSAFRPEQLNADLAKATGARTDAMLPLATSALPNDYASPVTGAAPKAIGEQANRKVLEAQTKGGDEARRIAAMQAFGDVDLGQKYSLSRGVRDMNNINENARQSSSILKYDFGEAQKKGDNWRKFSEGAKLTARLLAAYGAMGAGAGAGAGTVGPAGDIGAGELAPIMSGPSAGMNPYHVYGAGP